MKIRLANDFHNSEAVVMGPIVSGRAMGRAKRLLCGVAGCTCGGIRGVPTDASGRRYAMVPLSSDGQMAFEPEVADA